jgi:hypothetical protein
MTNSENSVPKKKIKKWHIVVIVLVVLTGIGYIGGDETPSTPTPTPTPEVQLSYSAEINRWEPINPASGRAVFTIRNTGEASFVPESCTVRVRDESSTYNGYDFVSGFGEIKPGAKFMANVVLTVTNQGAYFVTTGSVDCDLKAAG